MRLHPTLFLGLLCSSLATQAEVSPTRPGAGGPNDAYAATPSHLSILLRSYAEQIKEGEVDRHTWMSSARFIFDSGFTAGPIGFGLDLGLYSALNLDAVSSTRNFVYADDNGSGTSRDVWAYAGLLNVKAKHGNWVAKYGLHTVGNPVLEPFDSKSLPPSFKGLSVTGKVANDLTLDFGTFDGSIQENHSNLNQLSSAYGWVSYDRLTYLGLRRRWSADDELVAYAGNASDMWNQLYLGAGAAIPVNGEVRYRTRIDLYGVRSTGKMRQGQMNTTGASLMLGSRLGKSSLSISYQQIFGDQWLDFCKDSQGLYLANSVANDFNAPQEKSLQLRYSYRGHNLGMSKLNFSAWTVVGWGANTPGEASNHSATDSPLHNLYWKNGVPIQGRHREHGLTVTAIFHDGFFKGTTAALSVISHNVSAHYLGDSYRQVVFTLNRPLAIY